MSKDTLPPDFAKTIINVALLEGAALSLVVGAYFYTSDLRLLIGGIVAVAAISGPFLIRRIMESKRETAAKPNEITSPDLKP